MAKELNLSKGYRGIVEQFFIEASFLWRMREISLGQPHLNLQYLKSLELRLQANLEGLISAPIIAWEVCIEELEFERASSVFVTSILALTSEEDHKIRTAIKSGLASNLTCKALISAMAWLPRKFTSKWIEEFFRSDDLQFNYLAVAICSARREAPPTYFSSLCLQDNWM